MRLSADATCDISNWENAFVCDLCWGNWPIRGCSVFTIPFLKTEKKLLVELSDDVLLKNDCDLNSILVLGFDGASTLNREEKVVVGLMAE